MPVLASLIPHFFIFICFHLLCYVVKVIQKHKSKQYIVSHICHSFHLSSPPPFTPHNLLTLIDFLFLHWYLIFGNVSSCQSPLIWTLFRLDNIRYIIICSINKLDSAHECLSGPPPIKWMKLICNINFKSSMPWGFAVCLFCLLKLKLVDAQSIQISSIKRWYIQI
jgi:hypothetical protein